MNITSGKISTAQKIVVYGPEGIGKTTFAAQFPNPLFSDTEGSTKHIDVTRFDKPLSWESLKAQAKYVLENKPCKTYVIDTADWAEKLCIEDLCSRYKKNGLEDFGYGTGYVYLMEEFGRFLNLLESIVESGINIVLNAHAVMRKFEQPDEVGAYDRWELKLSKKVAPMVKEWADIILFANYKTFAVVAVDSGKKFKGQGGKRVMYTTHHPCWDAKNRHNLPEELPFEYDSIKHCIYGESVITENSQQHNIEQPEATEEDFKEPEFVIDEKIPNKKLEQLMLDNKVTALEIRKAIALKGHFPEDTPLINLPPDYVDGVLIGAWEQVFDVVKEMRKNYLF